MRDLDTLMFHPITEKITKLICTTFQNDNPMFFRILLSFHLTKMAAMMRVNVESEDMGSIPVNMYAINLASSGQGKGKATNLIEENIINQFTSIFLTQTWPAVVEMNLAKLAVERAQINGDDIDLVEQALKREFDSLGVYNTTFDSGSVEGIKEIRHKLLMCAAGSINMEVDEIAKNLSKNADLLAVMLELYDVGKVKSKLTKNAKDNIRREEIPGRTPTNMLMFGTPTQLMDGCKTETEFISWLETGYARRCLFGYSKEATKNLNITAVEVYKAKTDKKIGAFIKQLSAKFGALANIANYDKTITMSEKVSLQLIEYQLDCEKRASLMGEHEAIEQAELSHRYFKVLKLAGGYAFLDGQAEVSEDNLYYAICMAEESGKAFHSLLKRDKNYVKLGKYIASTPREVTLVDLAQDLPFFKGSKQVKEEMLNMSVIWGYKNHVIIKRTVQNDIEFITGETLKKSDLENMVLSYSEDISKGYRNAHAPFNKLYKLMTKPELNWVNHHVKNGKRDSNSVIPGCNMIVLDVDDGPTVKNAALLLKRYKFLLHTVTAGEHGHHLWRLGIDPTQHYPVLTGNFSSDC